MIISKQKTNLINHNIIMKKLVLLLFVMLMSINADAQYRNGQYLYCTGNNVNVRTGPGKNYRVYQVRESCPICGGRQISCWMCNGSRAKYQLSKGDGLGNFENGAVYIQYLGKSRNGFLFIETGEMIEGSGVRGWVSSQYLRPRR